MDASVLARLLFDGLIAIVSIAYAAGKRRERLEARGIKATLAEHKTWMNSHEAQTAIRYDEHARDTEERFNAASERFSSLTSKVQVMCVDQARFSERLAAIDARLTSLETRHTHFVESGGHGKARP